MDLRVNGSYIYVKPLKGVREKLTKFCSANKIKNFVGFDTLHTTLIYSRAPGNSSVPVTKRYYLGTNPSLDVFVDNENILVLTFDSIELDYRHHWLRNKYQFSHDYDDYICHITLSYDAGKVDLDTLKENLKNTKGLDFIGLKGEYQESLDTDWDARFYRQFLREV